MNATLHLLALLGLAPFSFALVRLVMTPPPTTGYSCCSDLGLSALTVIALLGFAAVVAAGIGATMVSLERRERGWAAILLGALALNTLWAVAFTLLSPFVVTLFQDSLHRDNARLLFEYTPEVVLAVVVLAYTVARHPAEKAAYIFCIFIRERLQKLKETAIELDAEVADGTLLGTN